VLITGNAETSSGHAHYSQAVRPQDEDNRRYVLGMLDVIHASFMPNIDLVDKAKVKALEKEMEVMKIKYDSLVHVVEGLRQQVLMLSHKLDLLDPNHQGEQ
jgi:hypothetical protein